MGSTVTVSLLRHNKRVMQSLKATSEQVHVEVTMKQAVMDGAEVNLSRCELQQTCYHYTTGANVSNK